MLALFALLLAGQNARAESDLGLWLSATVGKELGKRVEISVQEEFRFDQNISRLEEFLTEAAGAFRLHKVLRADLGFRIDYERDKTGLLVRRLMVFVAVRPRVRVGPVEIAYRGRFQAEARGALDEEDYRYALRNRIGVALVATRPWRPALSAEMFHRLGDGDTIRLQKVRLTAGVERELGDHEVQVYYRVEVAQDDPRDPTPHIIGISYQYMF